jgi:hypothetical protein
MGIRLSTRKPYREGIESEQRESKCQPKQRIAKRDEFKVICNAYANK